MHNRKGILSALVVIVGAVALFAATGLQTGAAKFGVVDMQRMLAESASGKAVQGQLQTELNTRQGVLEFINTNRVLTMDQATKLRDLSVKPVPTEADKTELDKLKDAIKAESKTFNDLMMKSNPTDTERAKITELQGRKQAMDAILQQWHQEMMDELNAIEAVKMGELGKKAKDVIQALGKKDGYSVVFPSNVAVYSANDITDAAIKALDAK